MKKIFVTFLLSTFIGGVYCQEIDKFTPQKGDWAIATDASNIINFINGYPSEGMLRGKYLLSDQVAIVGGLSFAGCSYSEYRESYKTNAVNLALGGQYFFTADKRIRPFVGANISYSAGLDKEKDENSSNMDIFTSPFYAYVGVGAECFVARNISLSTDFGVGLACAVERTFTHGNNGYVLKDVDLFFCYATGMGGLGGKLALNIYF